jgi:hypothetical protein
LVADDDGAWDGVGDAAMVDGLAEFVPGAVVP